MYLVIGGLISAVMGYFIPMHFAIGICIFLAIIIIFNLVLSGGRELDGIWNMIVSGILGGLLVGLIVGKGIDYVITKINQTKDEISTTKIELNQSNLPELICKSENNTFILVNYKNDKDSIINLKTDQVFNKSNCSLK